MSSVPEKKKKKIMTMMMLAREKRDKSKLMLRSRYRLMKLIHLAMTGDG